MLRQRLGVSFHRLHIVSRITFLYFLVLTDGPRLDRVFVSRLFFAPLYTPTLSSVRTHSCCRTPTSVDIIGMTFLRFYVDALSYIYFYPFTKLDFCLLIDAYFLANMWLCMCFPWTRSSTSFFTYPCSVAVYLCGAFLPYSLEAL
jgi:hypothetical protein